MTIALLCIIIKAFAVGPICGVQLCSTHIAVNCKTGNNLIRNQDMIIISLVYLTFTSKAIKKDS
jgi:hypothetical protein